MILKDFFQIFWPEEFLEAVLDYEPTLLIQRNHAKKPKGKKSVFFDATHLPIQEALELNKESEDWLREDSAEKGLQVYFGASLRKPGLESYQTGTRKDLVALPCVSLDIDMYDPDKPDHHASTNLPASYEEVLLLLDSVPEPSVIVFTGGGYHAHWLLESPEFITNKAAAVALSKRIDKWQHQIRKAAKKDGLHFQIDATPGVQRIWRPPGIFNAKNGKKSKVKEYDEDIFYNINDLLPKGETLTTVGDVFTENPSYSQDDVEVIDRVTKYLRKRAKDTDSLSGPIKKLLKGESFAEPGDRDNMLQRLCSVIGFSEAGRFEDPDVLAQVFRGSFIEWMRQGSSTPLEDELEKAAEKIARAQEDWQEKRKQDNDFALLAQSLRGAAVEDIAEGNFENEDKNNTGVTVSFALSHHIIQVGRSYFVYCYNTKGYINRPYTKDELLPVCRDAWQGEHAPAGLNVYALNRQGMFKPVVDLVGMYGTVATQHKASVSLQQSYFDVDTKTFHEATCPFRIKTAKRDKQFEEFVRLLGGEESEKLLDWLACIPRLDEPLCLVYISGPPNIGKNLLANGIAQLWGAKVPTDLNAITSFNSSLFKCPFVLIDEGLPSNKKDLSVVLRSMISGKGFTGKEKFLNDKTVEGAVRVMIGANNTEVLNSLGTTKALSVDDIEAIKSRVLHIAATDDAGTWLKQHNKQGALAKKWVEGGGIAKAILWLNKNREIKPGSRFLVEGNNTTVHEDIAVQGGETELIMEYIIKCCMSPKKAPSACVVGDGKLLANATYIVDNWDVHIGESFRPASVRKTGLILAALGEERARVTKKNKQVWYRLVDYERLLRWADHNDIGDIDLMRKNIESPIETQKKKFEKESDE